MERSRGNSDAIPAHPNRTALNDDSAYDSSIVAVDVDGQSVDALGDTQKPSTSEALSMPMAETGYDGLGGSEDNTTAAVKGDDDDDDDYADGAMPTLTPPDDDDTHYSHNQYGGDGAVAYDVGTDGYSSMTEDPSPESEAVEAVRRRSGSAGATTAAGGTATTNANTATLPPRPPSHAAPPKRAKVASYEVASKRSPSSAVGAAATDVGAAVVLAYENAYDAHKGDTPFVRPPPAKARPFVEMDPHYMMSGCSGRKFTATSSGGGRRGERVGDERKVPMSTMRAKHQQLRSSRVVVPPFGRGCVEGEEELTSSQPSDYHRPAQTATAAATGAFESPRFAHNAAIIGMAKVRRERLKSASRTMCPVVDPLQLVGLQQQEGEEQKAAARVVTMGGYSGGGSCGSDGDVIGCDAVVVTSLEGVVDRPSTALTIVDDGAGSYGRGITALSCPLPHPPPLPSPSAMIAAIAHAPCTVIPPLTACGGGNSGSSAQATNTTVLAGRRGSGSMLMATSMATITSPLRSGHLAPRPASASFAAADGATSAVVSKVVACNHQPAASSSVVPNSSSSSSLPLRPTTATIDRFIVLQHPSPRPGLREDSPTRVMRGQSARVGAPIGGCCDEAKAREGERLARRGNGRMAAASRPCTAASSTGLGWSSSARPPSSFTIPTAVSAGSNFRATSARSATEGGGAAQSSYPTATAMYVPNGATSHIARRRGSILANPPRPTPVVYEKYDLPALHRKLGGGVQQQHGGTTAAGYSTAMGTGVLLPSTVMTTSHSTRRGGSSSHPFAANINKPTPPPVPAQYGGAVAGREGLLLLRRKGQLAEEARNLAYMRAEAARQQREEEEEEEEGYGDADGHFTGQPSGALQGRIGSNSGHLVINSANAAIAEDGTALVYGRPHSQHHHEQRAAQTAISTRLTVGRKGSGLPSEQQQLYIPPADATSDELFIAAVGSVIDGIGVGGGKTGVVRPHNDDTTAAANSVPRIEASSSPRTVAVAAAAETRATVSPSANAAVTVAGATLPLSQQPPPRGALKGASFYERIAANLASERANYTQWR